MIRPAKKRRKLIKVIIGCQFGSEGAEELVRYLAKNADIVCLAQGCNYPNDEGDKLDKAANKVIPSAIHLPNCKSLIGNGVILNLPELFKNLRILEEKEGLKGWKDRLLISSRAQMVLNFHETFREETDLNLPGPSNIGQEIIPDEHNVPGPSKIGLENIPDDEHNVPGPSKIGLENIPDEEHNMPGLLNIVPQDIPEEYKVKESLYNLRICDFFNLEEFSQKLSRLLNTYKQRFPNLVVNIPGEQFKYESIANDTLPLAVDSVKYINDAVRSGKTIIAELANSSMYDRDMGIYPGVSPINCTTGSVCTGLGITPAMIGDIIGVVKAYSTRVGDGPFPTEFACKKGEILEENDGEQVKYQKRYGWLDLVMVKHAAAVNGFNSLCITKLNKLDNYRNIQICVKYKLNGVEIDYFPTRLEDWDKIVPVYETLTGWMTSTSNACAYSDLPIAARMYLMRIEYELRMTPLKWIGLGDKKLNIFQVESD